MKVEIDISKGIEVASYHYDIIWGDEIEKDLEASNIFGKCDNLNRRIKITGKFSEEQFNNTFIHECLEAINCVYCNTLIKEPQITNLANGLAQVFKSLGVRFVCGDKDRGDRGGNL